MSACIVQLPGNLDVGDSTGDTNDDMSGDGDTNDDMTGDGDGDMTDDGEMTGDGDGEPGPIDGDGCQHAVDILLVVDNSGSMGVLQKHLAESVDSLLAPLDAISVDWRLAITTTDVGNPWCPANSTTPEMGAFQLRACNDHLDDFLFNNGVVDLRDAGCNDICPYAPGKLYTLPSATADEPMPVSRPWIEHIGGESNLPGDIDPAQASLCLIPQGVNGCGFEQPLEAMYLAIERATNPGNPESGFLRDDASLLVVFVTDETDCSYADESIFLQDGTREFWSDQQASFPTSAVCWNAGMACAGDPDNYDDCVAVDHDVNGQPSMPDEAVLHPVSRYTDLLTQIEQQKRAIDPGADVGVMVLGGLGTDGDLHFSDVSNTDPQFQNAFGIGPGCEGADHGLELGGEVRAVPPGRLREVGAAMTSAPLASICADDYFDSFIDVYERLVGTCL